MSRSHRLVITVTVAVVAVLAAVAGIVVAAREDRDDVVATTPAPATTGSATPSAALPSAPVWGFVRSEVVRPVAGPTQVEADSAQAGSWQATQAGADAQASVDRTGTGRYTVTFPGIAVPGGSGAAIATALGGPDTDVGHCHVVDWAAEGADERVDVTCRTATGINVDSAFTVLFTFAPVSHRPAGGQPYAYFRNDTPSEPSARPSNGGYSFTGPGTIEINRIGEGHYNIDLIGEPYVRRGNNLQVNVVGDTSAGCNALGREVKADRQTIFVGCAIGQEWADVPFVVVYGNQHGMLPVEDYPVGHAFNGITQGGGPAMQPPVGQAVDAWPWYSANTVAATNTVRRLDVGRYEVTFPGIGLEPDHVQVTPYGEPTSRCVLDGWTSASAGGQPGDVVVSFHCVGPDDEPVDTFASVSYVSATPGATIATPPVFPAPTPTPAPTTAPTPTPPPSAPTPLSS